MSLREKIKNNLLVILSLFIFAFLATIGLGKIIIWKLSGSNIN